RPVGRYGLLLEDVMDRLVGERVVEGVSAFPALRDFHGHRDRAAIEDRLPLVHLAADEPVEVVEPLEDPPPIEQARVARLPIRYVVVLADESRAVAALTQDLREHRRALGDPPAVPGKRVPNLRDDAGPGRMVVASREQRGAGGRAERGGVEARVAKARF